MPNYNQTLQTNNSSLEEIITQLNNMPDAGSGGEQATPTITVNSSTGLITATAGAKTATKQLAFQAAKTITPGTMDQIAVSSGYYTGGNITVKGDSNLVASNIVSGKSIFGVVGTATAGGGGSVNTSIEDSLITRTITTYTNNRVTSIGYAAFASCYNLTNASLPRATSIGSNAFYYCLNLTSVSLPRATSIGDAAFRDCSSLTNVSFPVVTSIGYEAFYDCSSLKSVSFPLVKTIGDVAFYSCSSLTSVSFPQATSIGDYAFRGCSSLKSVSFPLVKTIGDGAFCECSSLTSVSFPQATSIGYAAFDYCSSLKSVSFPLVKTIGSHAFEYCSKLSQIYLTNSYRCTLAHSNAFSSTAITSTAGSIFVPASLAASYKAATNWTYFSNRIFGI